MIKIIRRHIDEGPFTPKFDYYNFYIDDLNLMQIANACGFDNSWGFINYLIENFNAFSMGFFRNEYDCQRAIDWMEPKIIMYKLQRGLQ
jgi:hypothetical protein